MDTVLICVYDILLGVWGGIMLYNWMFMGYLWDMHGQSGDPKVPLWGSEEWEERNPGTKTMTGSKFSTNTSALRWFEDVFMIQSIYCNPNSAQRDQHLTKIIHDPSLLPGRSRTPCHGTLENSPKNWWFHGVLISTKDIPLLCFSAEPYFGYPTLTTDSPERISWPSTSFYGCIHQLFG